MNLFGETSFYLMNELRKDDGLTDFTIVNKDATYKVSYLL